MHGFDSCCNLSNLNLDKIESITEGMLDNTGFQVISGPMVKNVDDKFVEGSYQLEQVDLPILEEFDYCSLYGCEQLRLVRLPSAKQIYNHNLYQSMDINITNDSS